MSDEPRMITSLAIPCERVLSAALANTLQSVIVIGWNVDGDFYFASTADGPSVLWDLELAKSKLMNIRVNHEE